MLFTRTHTYHFPLPKEEIKNRLVGKHVKIHNLDFEVLEADDRLTIIPHAEQEEAIKTLPITTVAFREEGNKTTVIVTSKMRQLDSGGPFLILTFCTFMLVTATILLQMSVEQLVAFTLLGISAFILTVFGIRMQLGYFDYVRKIREYVKSRVNPELSGAGMPLMHA